MLASKRVKEIMTRDPAVCTPDTDLRTVAHLMNEFNCGEIPVVQDKEGGRLVGVITDRDITCRTVAKGLNPLELRAADAMTSRPVSVHPDTTIEDCLKTAEKHLIRRVPVVDEDGCLCGIVAQADIARKDSPRHAAELVREVSRVA